MLQLTFDSKIKRVSCQLSSIRQAQDDPEFTERSNVKCKNGLSLVELIMGLGIVAFLILIIASVYVAHARLFSNQNTSIEVATQNKLALDEMTNQIREGQQVVTTCSLCGGDTTSATTLIMQIWPLDASGEPFEPSGSAYDHIVYKRDATDNTKLIKKIITDPASFRSSSEKIIASSISDLLFTYYPDQTSATEITISLTTAATTGAKTFTNTQTSKAVLRNK